MLTKLPLLFSLFFLCTFSTKFELPSINDVTNTAAKMISKLVEDDGPKIEDNSIEISPEEQAFDSTAWDIFNNFHYIFSNYQMFENPELDQSIFTSDSSNSFHKTVSFYNNNANELMFSVSVFNNIKLNSYTVTVMDLKYNNFSKTFESYDRREFVYQMPIYQQAIKHSLMYLPFWHKKIMHINLIEDVQHQLLKRFPGLVFSLGINPIDNLDHEIFEYKLIYKDMHMGSMKYTLYNTDKKEYLDDISLTSNFLGYISLSIPKDNKQNFDEFYFPSIITGPQEFNNLIDKMSNYLDFKNQFNNPNEFVSMVKEYFENVYKGITINETKDESSGKEFLNKTYKMSYEFASLNMHINTKIHDGNAVYNLKIYHPKQKHGMAIVNINLMRSSKGILKQFLDRANANSILKPVKDDILDMFKEQYKEFNNVWIYELNKADYGELKGFVNNPMFGAEVNGIKNNEFTCSFQKTQEGNKKLGNVKFISKAHKFDYSFSFKLENYDRFLIQKLMNNFFQGIQD